MDTREERINELAERLEEIIHKHALFSDEIKQLKSELNALRTQPLADRKEPEIKAVLASNPSSATEWENQVDLRPILSLFPDATKGKTKSGTAYVRIQFIEGGQQYVALFAESGKWSAENGAGTSLAHGRFKDTGKTLSVSSGLNKGKVISGSDLVAAVSNACGLSLLQKSAAAKNTTITAPVPSTPSLPRERSAIEKYIGENIITVIGIIIVLIGVVFGVKYSIDHNLISPLTRILMGYVLGAGILAVGMKLHRKFEQFSSVLISGSIDIMYFVTFIAYSLYDLLPQLMAFGMMVIFTAFIVFSAIKFNRQVIALIGLLGAYAVPFLLSNNSGNVVALFSYMTIINLGILIIGFLRNWRALYYASFGVTWLIYSMWIMVDYAQSSHFSIALVFGTLFFMLFYATFLAYKLLKKEQFLQEDVVMILLNSSVYYGLSYALLNDHSIGQHFLGMFTLLVGIVHFIVSVILFKTKLADRNLFYLTAGMVLVFLTIAIPVQLEGTWVTLLWSVEALLLFWIGKTKNVPIYEWISYPVMVFAIVSLGRDWTEGYLNLFSTNVDLRPIFNPVFLTSLLVTSAFGGILRIHWKEMQKERANDSSFDTLNVLSILLPTVVILLAFNTFRSEIDLYWQHRISESAVKIVDDYFGTIKNYNYAKLNHIWTLIYALVFVGGLSVINQFFVKSRIFAITNGFSFLLVALLFLTLGLFEISELRASYLQPEHPEYFTYGNFLIAIRYVSFAFLAIPTYLIYRETNLFSQKPIKNVLELFLYGLILWIACSELINWLDLSGSNSQHKLGLSILSGLYSFMLVGVGIWRNKIHLRIASFVLFGAVLLKLFFYDIAHLSTISKTIVFIVLGILLLIISFMYNKYQNKMNNDEK